MVARRGSQFVRLALLALLMLAAAAQKLSAQTTPQGPNEWLCDASYQDCRAPLIKLIQQENAGLDVAFWFMQDARYATEIIKRWQAGVTRSSRASRPPVSRCGCGNRRRPASSTGK